MVGWSSSSQLCNLLCIIKSDYHGLSIGCTTGIRDRDVSDINVALKSVTGRDEFQAQNRGVHFIPDITPGSGGQHSRGLSINGRNA